MSCSPCGTAYTSSEVLCCTGELSATYLSSQRNNLRGTLVIVSSGDFKYRVQLIADVMLLTALKRMFGPRRSDVDLDSVQAYCCLCQTILFCRPWPRGIILAMHHKPRLSYSIDACPESALVMHVHSHLRNVLPRYLHPQPPFLTRAVNTSIHASSLGRPVDLETCAATYLATILPCPCPRLGHFLNNPGEGIALGLPMF